MNINIFRVRYKALFQAYLEVFIYFILYSLIYSFRYIFRHRYFIPIYLNSDPKIYIPRAFISRDLYIFVFTLINIYLRYYRTSDIDSDLYIRFYRTIDLDSNRYIDLELYRTRDISFTRDIDICYFI